MNWGLHKIWLPRVYFAWIDITLTVIDEILNPYRKVTIRYILVYIKVLTHNRPDVLLVNSSMFKRGRSVIKDSLLFCRVKVDRTGWKDSTTSFSSTSPK